MLGSIHFLCFYYFFSQFEPVCILQDSSINVRRCGVCEQNTSSITERVGVGLQLLIYRVLLAQPTQYFILTYHKHQVLQLGWFCGWPRIN